MRMIMLFCSTACTDSSCQICDGSQCFVCKPNYVKDTTGACVG